MRILEEVPTYVTTSAAPGQRTQSRQRGNAISELAVVIVFNELRPSVVSPFNNPLTPRKTHTSPHRKLMGRTQVHYTGVVRQGVNAQAIIVDGAGKRWRTG